MGFDTVFWNQVATDMKEKVKLTALIIEDAHANVKTKFTETLKNKTIDISFEELEIAPEEDSDTGTKKATNWLANSVKKLTAVAAENRKFLKEIFGLLKEFATRLEEVHDKTEFLDGDIKLETENRTAMKKEVDSEVEKLKVELDEARQRGLKGNIIVSSPRLPARNNKLAQESVPRESPATLGRVETDEEYAVRLILLKTGVKVKPWEIAACHQVPQRNQDQPPSYLVSFSDRKDFSSWHLVTTCMMAGRTKDKQYNMDNSINIYLNFQLTATRASLAKAIRKVRVEGKVEKEWVNTNGQFKVRINNQWSKWVESEARLEELTRNIQPTPRNASRPNYAQVTSQGRGGSRNSLTRSQTRSQQK